MILAFTIPLMMTDIREALEEFREHWNVSDAQRAKWLVDHATEWTADHVQLGDLHVTAFKIRLDVSGEVEYQMRFN